MLCQFNVHYLYLRWKNKQILLWGGRYLFKSFQDQYKYGPSADLGAHVSYKLTPFISADITVANGEGYKSIQQDSLLKYSAGVTITAIEGLDLRVYYDYMGMDHAQQSLSFYAGYTGDRLRFGAEYNKQFNHKMSGDEHMSGFSLEFGQRRTGNSCRSGVFTSQRDNGNSKLKGLVSCRWRFVCSHCISEFQIRF